jgi:hypothetical protein
MAALRACSMLPPVVAMNIGVRKLTIRCMKASAGRRADGSGSVIWRRIVKGGGYSVSVMACQEIFPNDGCRNAVFGVDDIVAVLALTGGLLSRLWISARRNMTTPGGRTWA